MGLTSRWGIYHDDGSAPATGRQQDVKQALSVDAALSRVQSEAEVVAEGLVADKVTVASAAALGTVDATTFTGGLVGANFRPTWVEVAPDGGMPERVKKLVRGIAGFIEVDAPFTSLAVIGENYRSTVLGEAAQAAPTLPAPRFSDPKTWTHYGDSLTELGSPAALAALTGYTHHNAGISGNTAYQIAARAGATLYQVQIDAPAIPANGGSVAITGHAPAPMQMKHTATYPGELAGVPGYLKWENGVYRFYSQGDAPKPVAGWLTFTPGLYVKGRTGTAEGHSLIIGAGRNDLNLGIAVENTIVNIRKVIEASAATIPNYLVWEIPPWRTEPIGTTARTKYEAWNNALEAAFPGNFVRVAQWLRTEAAFTAIGMTPTDQDRADMAAGLTPLTFRRDNDGHLNADGNRAWAVYMKSEMEKRGWLYG